MTYQDPRNEGRHTLSPLAETRHRRTIYFTDGQVAVAETTDLAEFDRWCEELTAARANPRVDRVEIHDAPVDWGRDLAPLVLHFLDKRAQTGDHR